MKRIVFGVLIALFQVVAVQAAPVRIENHSGVEVQIVSRYWIDDDGDRRDIQGQWTFEVDEEATISYDGDTVEATKFCYTVRQDGNNKDFVAELDDSSESRLVVEILPRDLPEPLIAKHLHIVFLADTHADRIGDGVQAGYGKLVEVIGEIRDGREDKISWVVYKDEGLTPSAVLGHLRSQSYSQPTSVFVFYAGHGGMDDDGRHFFAMKYGNLYREDVRRAMEGTGAVLQVLLSDCCSNFAGFDPPNRRIPAEWEAFKQLFFQCRGIVDITAAEAGTFSWTNSANGGFFTNVFAKMLCDPISETDFDGDGFVAWNEFYPRLRRDTNEVFVRARESASGPRRTDEYGNQLDDIRDYENQLAAYYYLNYVDRWENNVNSATTQMQYLINQTNTVTSTVKTYQNALGSVNTRAKATAMAGYLKIEADALGQIRGQIDSIRNEARLAWVIAAAQGNSSAAASASQLCNQANELDSTLQTAAITCLTYAVQFQAAANRMRY